MAVRAAEMHPIGRHDYGSGVPYTPRQVTVFIHFASGDGMPSGCLHYTQCVEVVLMVFAVLVWT